ncbi:MAG: electron transfer flavoprotein subunit alpha/FixB family protein [Actinomyces sp.]|jgi:electron transfer flavoprotein alpha subunit|nr:electron transfer flavoprotein subunit alpha/FixB family protein [Actinomyces sp.]MCI1691669.1 electron transfer flavoprotein subunit alpha/FixB family protein [Actinomyces sp.]MCI1788005.1 electron transfer flavoprotein subunit alpha/FixB family protein [Actinomyces sp.]MCI1830554.1 electron transfer flavoprotein subunit alpha/FixB family protein [Actinomyces sp.]
MTAWIVAADKRVASVVELARSLGGQVIAVTVGDVTVGGVDRVVNVPVADGVPVEAAAPGVAAVVTAGPGDVVLAANRPAERVLAGALAARLGAPVLTDVVSLSQGAAEVSVFGGVSRESVSFAGPVVAVVDGGAAAGGEAPSAETADAQAHDATVTSTERQDVGEVDLVAAKRIVAAGRGFKSEEDLALARDLCGALGAELACSRPLAEGVNWLPRDRYVGVSGQKVSPDLYVAVGISGQVQHTMGMNGSTVVVAVNSDGNAPIFRDADYGIVGDLYQVLPAIVAAAK